MFETSETTFEVFSLRSYVSIRVCGRFFEMWGIPFSKWWKRAAVSDGEVIIAWQVNEGIIFGTP
jgi:hypothetical protein